MNDIKQQIKIQIWHKGELKFSYDLISKLINTCPMGALNYITPVEKMKEVLKLVPE